MSALHSTFRNPAGNVVFHPARRVAPATLAGLVREVNEARAAARPLRAVGSGLSYSEVLQTGGTILDPRSLVWARPVPHDLLRPDVDGAALMELGSGTTLRLAQRLLAEQGRSLVNLPGLQRQTIAGAIATGTHGSGLGFGPLCDEVVSILIVSGRGEALRLEPTDGPSGDGAGLAGVRLVRDDELFGAALLSLGALGSVHSCWVRVGPPLILCERRYRVDLREALRLIGDSAWLRGHRHVEVLIEPGGARSCLVSTRELAPGVAAPTHAAWRIRKELASQAAVGSVLVAAGNRSQRAFDMAMEQGLRWLEVDDHVAELGVVLDMDGAARQQAFSAELAVPLAAAHEAVAHLVAGVEDGRLPFARSLPIALRFVGPSRALLAPSWDGPVCTIEWPTLAGTRGAFAQLDWFQERLAAFAPRPHWGQIHHLPHDPRRVDALYGRAEAFRRAARELDPDGLFANDFTARWGLAAPPAARRAAREVPPAPPAPHGAVSPRIEAELPRRAASLPPAGSFIEGKRDVHAFEVSTRASAFAHAFAAELQRPESYFGLVHVKRPAARVGAPFVAGERFQGGFDLDRLLARTSAGWPRAARRPLEWLRGTGPVRQTLTRLEELFCSDFAEVEEVTVKREADDERWLLVYRYLEGTPIIGHTEYAVVPTTPGACRVTQTFTYREINAMAWLTFQSFGLALHNECVYWQIDAAARRAGGRILASTLSRPRT
jgi:L-gulonolactone oxidase